MTKDELYMMRCIELAKKAAGSVAPNPMVGAVLVHDGKIIAEGWHQRYGEAHAEVNCIKEAIKKGYRDFIPHSTLYVSLEPCSHFGKTPPCTDLIIKHQIKKVVIGCRDPFKEVNGRGIEKLNAAGVETVVDVLKEECIDLNKGFFTFHLQHRPFIILKWAQTGNGKIGTAPLGPPEGGKNTDSDVRRLLISNEFTKKLVHKWRSEEASILVGTNTALLDDPQLTNRYWKGNQPVRLVLDKDLKLPSTLQLFNHDAKTIIFNTKKNTGEGNVQYYQIASDENAVYEIIKAIYQLQLQTVLVEGGAQLLKSFIDAELWDEARVIENTELKIENGLAAPVLMNHQLINEQNTLTDSIKIFKNLKYKI
jgi:diaminohydroxyphosphoribosylaminopyrimidine deaminase / 5-amino-6-(5-phosphoribosylamino)uracil reductase